MSVDVLAVEPIDEVTEDKLRARIREILESSDYKISYTRCLHELALCGEFLPEVLALVDALRERLDEIENGDHLGEDQ